MRREQESSLSHAQKEQSRTLSWSVHVWYAIFLHGKMCKGPYTLLYCRYGLVRVRENAESIAFYGGEASEMQLLYKRVQRLVDNAFQLIRTERNLQFFTSFYRPVLTKCFAMLAFALSRQKMDLEMCLMNTDLPKIMRLKVDYWNSLPRRIRHNWSCHWKGYLISKESKYTIKSQASWHPQCTSQADQRGGLQVFD